MINPLAYSSFLSTPRRIVKPYWWLQHVPFAMFLVDLARPKILVELGTHTGNSYCAFCQAVQELSLDTQCYAVDTWQGDPHEVYNDEGILENLKAFHDPLFGRFSNLIQTSFDDAVRLFNDKSIDLLHIDGYHTYEAVKHDFETWLPKISSHGIVLFHDIAVRKQDFGVWKYWSEIKENYPTFEFIHGMGLGVAFVGSEPAGETGELFSMPEGEAIIFQEFFFDIGYNLSVIVEKEEKIRTILKQVVERDQQILTLNQQMVERDQAAQALMTLVTKKERAEQMLTMQEAEHNRAIKALLAQVAARSQAMQTLWTQMVKRDRAVAASSAQVAKRDQLVHSLKASRQEGGIVLDLNGDLVKSSSLFDEKWYLANYPDVAQASADPLLHYLHQGGFNGYNPSPHFDSAWYLDTYQDVKKSGINPLVHFLKNGKLEKRDVNQDSALIRTSGMFDEAWYMANNPDVIRANISPITHYLLIGGFEGRDPCSQFSSKWYLETYSDANADGANPLVHYLRHGKGKGRFPSPTTRNPLIKNLPITNSYNNLYFQIYSSAQGGSASEITQTPFFDVVKEHDTAVITHLYYPELWDEIWLYLSNLGDKFDLFVSIPDTIELPDAQILRDFPRANICRLPNRGRDIAPFISIFKSIYQQEYKYMLKLHTKRSPHREDGEIWRQDLLGKLVGSRKSVQQIKATLHGQADVGIIGAQGHVLPSDFYWDLNESNVKRLASQAHISFDGSIFPFVAGSMFWFNPLAFYQVSMMKISQDDFETEQGQVDGTLAHAFERFFGLLMMQKGFQIAEINENGNVIVPNYH